MSLKFTGNLFDMAMKFEDELTCPFKTDMKDFMNFDPSTQKSKNFAL